MAPDTLSRDLANGCEQWPDVTGSTSDRHGVQGDGRDVPRSKNPRW